MDNKMKKILLTTTALGLFAAGSAFAAGPVVTLGGYADFQVGNGSQKTIFENQAGAGGADTSIFSRSLHTRTDTELHIKVDGKADNGLGYGAYIELEADVNPDDSTATTTNNAERTYLYVETGFGRVEAGATGDAADALRVDASTFARATGGIGGDFYKYVDLGNSTTTADNFMILPGLPTAVGLPGEANFGQTAGVIDADTHNARATANKVSYYSPRIQGAQFGLSYTPDQSERGTANGFGIGNSDAPVGQFENVFNAGLNYQGQFNNVGIEASLTGEMGNTKDDVVAPITNYDDLEAYAAGLSLSYAGFTAGGSYGDAPEVGQLSSVGTEVSYWTLGAAYEFGPFATSLTYMDSTVKNPSAAAPDKEFTNLSLGADYQLAPGLVPYVEVSFFDTDDNVAATADNSGTVLIVGTELNF
jgi:predicted porin